MQKIFQILNNLKPDFDFKSNAKLIDEGILDSFDIVTLVGELNYVFDINIGVEHLLPENFNSVKEIKNLILQLKNE